MLTTEQSVQRVTGVTKTLVSPIAQNPETGRYERYYKFLVGDTPVLTVTVDATGETDIEVVIPEHTF